MDYVAEIQKLKKEKDIENGTNEITTQTENYLNNLSGGEPLTKQEENYFGTKLESDWRSNDLAIVQKMMIAYKNKF